MKNNYFLFLFFLFVGVEYGFTQTGTIQGTVVEASTNEPIIGARIFVNTTTSGAVTDLDGNFEITLPQGSYSLTCVAYPYDSLALNNIVLKSNETLQIPVIRLEEIKTEIEQVTIRGTKKLNSEVAFVQMKMKSLNAIDGVSAASIKKSGDSDAASAMSRIPGVSVANGKYVFIRGIGDRYNKTLLNGMELPGLDPDKNSMQLDIIPTAILDNILIHKTFLAELPADFAGGIMDMNLKNVPDKQQGEVSLNVGYNPNYHFNKNYLSQEASSTDFLGFDNGKRKIPATENIPFYAKIIGNTTGNDAMRYKEILSKFNPNMAAIQQMSGMDYGLSVSYGNRKALKNSTLGFRTMVSYTNQTEFFKNATYNRFGLKANPTDYEMEMREQQIGSFGVNSAFLNASFGLGWIRKKSSYTLSILHLQNSESKAGIFDYESNDQGAVFSAYQHNLEFNQRGLTNIQVGGKHRFGQENSWNTNWTLSSSLSNIQDPDVRLTRYRVQESGVSIGTESGFPERIWRTLKENNFSGKVDFAKTFTLFKKEGEIKFGVGNTFKARDFNIRTFMVNVRNIELIGNPDELFAPENLWPYREDVSQGTTVEATFLPNNPNQFHSSANNAFGYVSAVINPVKALKAILGLRSEYYLQRYTGRDQMGYNILNNDVVLKDIGIFPSVNFIYAISERQNLRLSYGKTIARPSFKEMSYAEIADPLTGRTFIGGLFKDEDKGAGIVYWDGKLQSTNIHNVDLRWEIFPTHSQVISVSAFYKQFIRPIEIVQYASQAGSFQPRNVGNGHVLGGEVELRIGLDFITDKLKDVSIISNITVTDSRIQLNETEKQSRINNARDGEKIKDYRKMAGQAPYVVNAGLAYSSSKEKGFLKHFDAGVFYNLQGSTLIYVGMVDRPDIYSVPFHSLNVTVSKKFGKSSQWNVGLKVTNLLNDKKEEIYKSFHAMNQYFSRLTIGTSTSVKVSYSF